MKSLQKYLMENLIKEAYKAQFGPADWDNVLKQFKPEYANLSQLGGLEHFVEEGEGEDTDWIDNMIEGGVANTPENINTLTDIFNWAADKYECITCEWGDGMEEIIGYVDDMKNDKTMWAVDEEEVAIFMIPMKKLSGIDKKLGEVLARYGNSGEVEKKAEIGGED